MKQPAPERTRVVCGGLTLPCIMQRPAKPLPGRARVVIVCHGFTANKEANVNELQLLARAGLTGVTIDAPHHGERDDGWLAGMVGLDPAAAHARFLELVDWHAHEIPLAVRHFAQTEDAAVGLVGISMGGFVAYASLARAPRVAACAPVIACPDWTVTTGVGGFPRGHFDPRSPHLYPERVPPVALLTITAGRDQTVPPQAAQAFVEALRPLYEATPERLDAVDYPDSEHMMRPMDWADVWRRINAWMGRFLG